MNALALKYECAKKHHVLDDMYTLPRFCALSEELSFSEPLIGHEIWIDEISRYIDIHENDTLVVVLAYAYSHKIEELPDSWNQELVKSEVEKFAAEKLSGYSYRQIFTALDYVRNGCNSLVGEYVKPTESKDESEEVDESEDWDTCIAVGVMYKGAGILTGCTLAEIKHMTIRQLDATIECTLRYRDKEYKSPCQSQLKDYYLALDRLTERLQKEKEKEGI